MNRLLSLVGALLAFAAGAVIILQQSTITGLQAERQSLQERLQGAQQKPAAAGAQPSAQPAPESPDLLRLRNEVTQLRAEQKRAAQIEAENQQLKSQVSELRGNIEQLNSRRSMRPDVPGAGVGAATARSGWIGLSMAAGPNATVVVNGVAPNSPAAQAQLQQGDVIVGIDGVAVTNLAQVAMTIGSRQPGQAALLQFLRGGIQQQVYVTPQAPPQELQFNAPGR